MARLGDSKIYQVTEIGDSWKLGPQSYGSQYFPLIKNSQGYNSVFNHLPDFVSLLIFFP